MIYKPEDFVGHKITDLFVDGYGVEITIDSGLKLMYDASDGGYSSYEVVDDGEPDPLEGLC